MVVVRRKKRTAGLRTYEASARGHNKHNCSRHTCKKPVGSQISYSGELGHGELGNTAYHTSSKWMCRSCKYSWHCKGRRHFS